MTLRARLVAGLVVLLVTLVVSGVAITVVQHRFLTGQLDDQLEALAGNAPRLLTRGSVNPAALANLPTLGDVYLGSLDQNGELMTLISPTDEPTLVPELPADPPLSQPFTVEVSSPEGEAGRARVLMVAAEGDEVAVIALPMDRTEAAFTSLMATLLAAGLAIVVVLSLVAWWVVRLGLRPIAEMTSAADAIAAGAVDRRVTLVHGGAEADRLATALNTMVDANQAAERQLRRFVADASHELRTPLTTLRGYVGLYRAGGLTEPSDMDDAMGRIESEAVRMAGMVDDLLLLAELDEQRPLHIATVDLAEMLAAVATDMAAIQPSRPIDVDCVERLEVQGDRDRLTQAITALAANALAHTGSAVPVTLFGRCVRDDRVGGRGVGATAVRVEVRDEGDGIPEADLPRLFDRFYRTGTSRAGVSRGNGLGLSIVASIVSAHGGRFGVESVEGVGSVFWFELPAMSV